METKLEYILTHLKKADMVSHMKSHPEDFNEAVRLALSDKQPYSWRAAWLLWSCMGKNDKRIRLFINSIIDCLPTMRDNQLRELLIILQRMELSDNQEGKLFDICVTIWEKTGKQPSVRYSAFMLIAKIANKHPDLSKELILLTETHYMDSLSDTVKKSVFRMIKGLAS